MPNPVYDDEKTNKDHHEGQSPAGGDWRPSSAASGSHAGSRERGHMRRMSSGGETHQQSSGPHKAEREGATPKPTAAESAEGDKLGRGFTGGSDEPRRGRRPRLQFTRSKAILGGGLAAMLVGGAIGISSVTSGPLKLIHAGQLLQQFHFSSDEEFMDSRVGKIIRWSRTRNAQERRNLSYFGNKVADRYTQKLTKAGITPDYENGRIRRLTFDTNNPRALQSLNELRARSDIDIDIPDPDANGRVTLDLPSGLNSTRTRRAIFGGAISGIGFRRRTSAMVKRILYRRAKIEWHPWTNVLRDIDEGFWDYVHRRRDEWRERHATGDTDVDTRRFNGAEDEDGNGNTTRNPANDNVAGEAADIVGDGDIEGMKGRLTGIFSGGVGVAGAATLICALDQFGDTIPEVRQAQVVLPLMRMGMDFVTMSNQGMAAMDFNLDEMGAMVTRMYDANAEPGAQEFFGARTFQAELGQDQTGPDMPSGSRPNTDRPQIFQVINTITAATGVSQVCGFVTSTVGGWIVDIADWGLSGGPAQALVAATTDILTGQLLAQFVDDLARWIAGEPLALDALGAQLGNFANFGVRLAANEAAISHGATALTGILESELEVESEHIAQAEFQQKSAYDRFLNPYETRSLVGKAMIQNPEITSPTSTIATVIRSPFKTLAGTARNLASAFTPQAAAQTGRYDYGFPAFGFSRDEMDSERYEDPFENAERVEPHLAEYNERFGDCFGTIIDPDTYQIRTKTRDTGIRYDLLKAGENTDEGNFSECGSSNVLGASTDGKVLAGSQALQDYRFYLADMHAAKAMACYENLDEEACIEVTEGLPVEEPAPAGGGGGTGGPCPNIPVAIGETTEVVQGSVRIRVNNCIADQIQQLLVKAEQDGINFAGSGGWRDPQQQIALRRQNCGTSDYAIYEMPSGQCSPPTAKPGTSNHESGTAIDFECNGNGTLRHGDPCWNWLVANAATFGLQNFPRESWHWSIDGT